MSNARTNADGILNISVHSQGIGFTNGVQNRGVYVNGTRVFSCGRSWGLTVISTNGATRGQVIHASTYDVYSDAANAASMINDMSTYFVNNNILLFNTYDEPNNNAGTLKSELVENYGAKLALAPMSSRGAYAYGVRHGYGSIGESHSAYWNGATLTTSGTNDGKCVAGFYATVRM
jgi:hypothetical protein